MSSSAESLKIKGNENFKKGDYVAALDQYSRAIAQDPQGITYYSNRAACYIKLEKWEQSINDCSHGLELKGDSKTRVKLLWRKGLAQRKLGLLQQARQSLEAALEIDADNSTVKEEINGLIWDEKKAQRKSKGRLLQVDTKLKAKSKSIETLQQVPVTIVDTLPKELKQLFTKTEETATSKMTLTPKAANSVPGVVAPTPRSEPPRPVPSKPSVSKLYIPTGPFTIQTMMFLLRTPPAQLPQLFSFLYGLDPAKFARIFGQAGVESEVLDLVLDAAIYQNDQFADKATWALKTNSLLTALSTCARFDIAKIFISSSKLEQLLKLFELVDPAVGAALVKTYSS
ncbi:TPR-like protein [Nadsonia fulvescens var. elongata DSM 6958]|uniref:RNA polymerase II-associated protein 3 n=1 Tax=Nadsonia fulvescens var. elongata DSM 6958 TaxID=857566 RepID=A0A1E3PQ97_9ASCO|nr:TPR-like protein [Nadsonia fulvescens var. elongata DSM 6958]